MCVYLFNIQTFQLLVFIYFISTTTQKKSQQKKTTERIFFEFFKWQAKEIPYFWRAFNDFRKISNLDFSNIF